MAGGVPYWTAKRACYGFPPPLQLSSADRYLPGAPAARSSAGATTASGAKNDGVERRKAMALAQAREIDG
jgi:hypothetical protein